MGEYCFPASAEMYLKNPDGLNWRFNTVLAKIGIFSTGAGEDENSKSAVVVGNPQAKRLRAANLFGYAACKTTFVTVSLDSGIPEMMVRKVVGNEVVDLVLKHYYQPGEQELKRQFLEKLPAGLGGGEPETKAGQILAEMGDLLAGSRTENWRATRDELKAMLLKLKQASDSMGQ